MKISDSENKLFNHFKLTNTYDSDIELYRDMIVVAFSSNDESEYAEALRNAYNAFISGACKRGTKEFDTIIESFLTSTNEEIKLRLEKLQDFFNKNKSFIVNNLTDDKSKDQFNGFKWTQLIPQEIFMYNKIGEQIEQSEFDWLCDRRGFNNIQCNFLIDALKCIGLGNNLVKKDTAPICSDDPISKPTKKDESSKKLIKRIFGMIPSKDIKLSKKYCIATNDPIYGIDYVKAHYPTCYEIKKDDKCDILKEESAGEI